jgi:hypothetical protein
LYHHYLTHFDKNVRSNWHGRRPSTCNLTLRRVRVTIFTVIISITYSECVLVALGIEHAKRMHHIVISGLLGVYNICPYYPINSRIFGKKLLNTKCVFRFSLQLFFSEKFVRSKKNSARYCHKCTQVFV